MMLDPLDSKPPPADSDPVVTADLENWRFQASAIIARPVEEVFEFADKPENEHLWKSGADVELRRLAELRPGDIFAQDVTTRDGLLLVSRGMEANELLLGRLGNLGSDRIDEPIRIESAQDDTAEWPKAA